MNTSGLMTTGTNQTHSQTSPEREHNKHARHSVRYAVQHGLLSANSDDYIEGVYAICLSY